MPQLHFSVSEDIAEKVRSRALHSNMTVSRYLADIVAREVGDGWPPGFFDEVVGSWQGPSLERPPQGEYEVREQL